MTYPKPSGITYTQIAQWVDANAALPDCDENKLCQYLYHLVYVKTQQCSFFKDYEQADDFSLYCVSRLFSRLRQESKAGPIKSITNYIKIVIGPWRADYVKEFCSGSYECELADFDPVDFSDYLVDVSSIQDYNSYTDSCICIIDIARKHLKKIPRKKNSVEWSNIYVSCLLTLQDRIKIASCITSKKEIKENPQSTNALIRSLKKRPPILYHIDDYMSNYITTLVNELIHAIAAEISYCTYSKVSVSGCMRNLVIAASNEEGD